MPKKLFVTEGVDVGREFVLAEGVTTLGRSQAQADFAISDPHVSRVHCEIVVAGEEAVLSDLDSAGGTCVNGRKITRHELSPGDVVRIGGTQLTYSDGDRPIRPAQARSLDKAVTRVEEMTGQLLGHYQVGPIIAKGQSGIVFQGTDLKHQRAVALKILWPEFSQSEEEVLRFTRAMKTMLPLSHPHLVTLYGAGKSMGYCWVAMEHVAGESLAQVIARIGKEGLLDWRHALRVAIHVGLALEYALQRQFIHRNITPTNVLVRSTDRVTKLGDLMLAKALEGTLAQQITRPGALLGDVAYFSPERTTGAGNVDHRSDIYGLGATCYALLAGKPPFVGFTLPETIEKIRKQEPIKPRKFQPSMPEVFENALLRMLAKKPEDRFQTPAEMLLHLEHAARSEQVEV